MNKWQAKWERCAHFYILVYSYVHQMSVGTEPIREIQFSWKHECPFNDLTEEIAGLNIRWETPAVGIDEESVLSRFTIDQSEEELIETVKKNLKKYPSIRRVEQTGKRTFTCILSREMITMSPELLSECLSVSIHEHDGIEEWQVRTPSSRVERFLFDTLSSNSDAQFRLERKVALQEFNLNEETLRSDLTDKQEEAIIKGLQKGYFEYPRESTAKEAASELGITASSFTSRVRRGQRRLIESIFASESDEHTTL